MTRTTPTLSAPPAVVARTTLRSFEPTESVWLGRMQARGTKLKWLFLNGDTMEGPVIEISRYTVTVCDSDGIEWLLFKSALSRVSTAAGRKADND